MSPGVSEWVEGYEPGVLGVEGYEPGVLGVACFPFSEPPEGGPDPLEVPLTIYDPKHLFVDRELRPMRTTARRYRPRRLLIRR